MDGHRRPRVVDMKHGYCCLFLLSLAFLLTTDVGISVASGPPPPPSGRQLNSWSFNDTNLLSNYGTGPRWAVSCQLVPSWSSNAVNLMGDTAFLNYPDQVNGVTNVLCHNGSVLLWFRPIWSSANLGGTGPQRPARLLELGAWTSNAMYGWWSFYLDHGGTNLYFSAQSNGYTTNYLKAGIEWTAEEWQLLTLTYTPSNSALYLNGYLLTNGLGVSRWPSASIRATNGFSVGSDTSGGNAAQGDFEMLRTFDYPLSPSFISNYFIISQPFHSNELVSGNGLGNSGNSIADGVLMDGGLSALTGEGGEPLTLLTPIPVPGGLSLSFTGGESLATYDLFFSENLVPAWSLITRSAPGQTNFALTSLPPLTGFFVLGTMQDADGDGLTDAYEGLVSSSRDQDSDQMPDDWESLNGLDPFVNDAALDLDGDGITNLREFLGGTNPNYASAFGINVTRPGLHSNLP